MYRVITDLRGFTLTHSTMIVFQPVSSREGVITIVRGNNISGTKYNGTSLLNIEVFGKGSFTTVSYARRNTPKPFQKFTAIFRRRKHDNTTTDAYWKKIQLRVDLVESEQFQINNNDVVAFSTTEAELETALQEFLRRIGVTDEDLKLILSELLS